MKRLIVTTVGASLLTIASCGVEGKKSKKKTEKTIEIYGEWEQDCKSFDFAGLSHYADQVKFNPVSEFEQKTRIYDNSKCEDGLAELTVRGDFEILGEAKGVEGARNINFTIKEARFKPQDDKAVDALNTLKYCGFENWKKNQSKDILNRNCKGAKYSDGMVIFDIYKREKDTIFFGEANNWLAGKTTNDRPAELAADGYDKN